MILKEEIDPSVVVTHFYPLSKISDVYKLFDEHKNGMIKAILIPEAIYEKERPVLTGQVPKTN